MRDLNNQDIEDIFVGGKILGTGGGGEEEWVRPLVRDVHERGKRFTLVDPTELPPKETVVIVSRIGGGVSKEQAASVAKLAITEQRPELRAFQLLVEYLGEEPFAILPTELGAGNSVAAMCTAAILDKPTVDADCAGRAKPEVSISTTCLVGLPLTPACLVTRFGDVVYLEKTANDRRCEDILRAVTVASGGMAGLCRSPIKGSEVRNAVVRNSVSMCINLGKSVRESRGIGRDPIDSALAVVDGLKFFEGSVSSFARDESGGFMRGEFTVRGRGRYTGHKLRVWFKNENLVSWLDGRPYVTCPDSICVIDSKSGLGLSNWGADFSIGRKVTVFGIKAHPLFRTSKGLECFGPVAFGYNIKYASMERLVKS